LGKKGKPKRLESRTRGDQRPEESESNLEKQNRMETRKKKEGLVRGRVGFPESFMGKGIGQ